MLRRIESIAEYQAEFKAFQVGSASRSGNAYPVSVEVEAHILQRRLYANIACDALQFFADVGAGYQLSLVIAEDCRSDIPRLDKPVFTQIVYHERQGPPNVLKQYLQEQGFCQKYAYCLMAASRAVIPPGKEIMPPYQVRHAQLQDIPAILEMLQSQFDELSGDLPDARQLEALINNGLAWCAVSPGEEICGYLQAKRQGKDCLIQHVSVSERHRRKGLAMQLLAACLTYMRDVSAFRLWVEHDNQAARELYRRCGFEDLGRRMEIFIRL